MMLTPEVARRSVDAIFQCRDERAIALLRVTSETLMCHDTIELLYELQKAYVSELVILPLIPACDRQHLAPAARPPAGLSARTNVAIALETSPPTGTAGRGVFGGWWLGDQEALPDCSSLAQQPGHLPILIPTSTIGWVIPSDRGTLDARPLAAEYQLGQPPRTRQFFLDLASTDNGNLPIQPQLLAEMLCDDREALGGFVLSHTRGNVDAGCPGDPAQRRSVDTGGTKAALGQIAHAVMLSLITKSTRRSRLIRRGL